jgi:PAS domain S-box-containing protein
LRDRLALSAARERAAAAEADVAGRWLAAVVDSTSDAVVAEDLDGTLRSWNAGATRLFGYTPAEVIGRPVMMLVPPELRDEEAAILERLRRGEQVAQLETVRVRRDGSRLHVSLSISPIRDATGRIVGAAKIVRDITERMRAERALAERADYLARSNAELDQFAYVTSHDLRAPLRGIANLAEWIEKDLAKELGGTVPARVREHLAKLRGRVARMDGLIDGILQYSRAGRARERPERVDVGALVAETVELLAPPPGARVEASTSKGPQKSSTSTSSNTSTAALSMAPPPERR